MKPARPILSGSPNGNTGGLSVREAVDAIRSAGVFDERFYLERYMIADPLLKFVDPISHYLLLGCHRAFTPSQSFDTASYRARYMRGVDPDMNPLLHLSLGAMKTKAGSASESGDMKPARARKLRRKEPDFSSLSLVPRPAGQPVIDVIMPVYAGFIETLQAIHAVLSSRNVTPYELIIANDCSPDGKLVENLEILAKAGLITLFTNRRNLGFVRTVNRVLAMHKRREAILLNSDTMVSGNWIDRLCGHTAPGVATVTPFSNNAALCSYPRIFEENDVPQGMTSQAIDRTAARVNRGQAVDVPTGVGFCMYVSRAAIRAVGPFDAAAFGRGYGEENDFCLRARKAGFRNLHALDVFVFHKGSASFGDHGSLLKQRHYRKLVEKHPDYRAQIRQFALADPALPARQRLDAARLLRRGQASVVLYVAGETDKALVAIRKRHKRSRRNEVPVLVRPDPGGRSVRLEAMHDDGVALPNLKGLSLEGDASLFGGIFPPSITLRMEVHGVDGYASGFLRQMKGICQDNGIAYSYHASERRTLVESQVVSPGI